MNKNESKVLEIDLLIKSSWIAISKMYSKKAQFYNTTTVQALTLLKIDPKHGTKSTNLGPKMAVEPTSLSRIIKFLEDNGYIYKEKSKTDQREVIIKLTEKGLLNRDKSKSVVQNFNNQLISKIDSEKIDVFKEVLDIITKTANQMSVNKIDFESV